MANKPFQALQDFGRGAYGRTDTMLGGALPGGPIQGNFQIPLQAYMEKRRIKGDVLKSLHGDVEHYIRNGLEPEQAIRLVLGNKRLMFEKVLDPESMEAQAIAGGDTETALGKAAHNAANIFKYFESASPKEYSGMFSDYGVTDVDLIKGSFTLPDVAPVAVQGPAPEPASKFTHPSLAGLAPTFKENWNKLGFVQNAEGEWVPGRKQPVGGYGAHLSKLRYKG